MASHPKLLLLPIIAREARELQNKNVRIEPTVELLVELLHRKYFLIFYGTKTLSHFGNVEREFVENFDIGIFMNNAHKTPSAFDA